MQFFEIKKILSLADFNFKNNLIFSLISSFLEVVSLGSLIPLVIVLVEGEGDVFQKIEKFLPITLKNDNFSDYYLSFTLLILAIYLLTLIIYIFLRYLIKRNILRFQANLAHKIFSEYLKRDFQVLVNEKVSNVHNTIAAETKRFTGGILNSLFEIISKLNVLILICIFLLWYKPIITSIIILSGVILMGFLFFIFKKRIYKFNHVISEKNSQNFEFLRTGLNSFLDLKIFNLSINFLEKYRKNCLDINNQNLNIEMISLFPKLLVESVIILVFFTAIVFSNIDIKDNLLLISVFVFSFYKIYPYLSQIFNYMVLLQASKSSIKKIINSLNNFDTKNANLKKSNINFNKDLILKDIDFSYDDKTIDKFNLNKFNLKINNGDIVGIIGPTGSGKTTIINILLGLLKPKSGQVLVDGVCLDHSNLELWMTKISYASINPFFTNNSIKKNITFKDALTDDEEIRLKKIYEVTLLDDVFKKLADQDLTIISDSNLNLSSGQKQRVNIARALFKGANLVFFDEPTSALDFETEEKVLEKIMTSGLINTAVFATHRKEVLKYCDKVFDLTKTQLT